MSYVVYPADVVTCVNSSDGGCQSVLYAGCVDGTAAVLAADVVTCVNSSDGGCQSVLYAGCVDGTAAVWLLMW